MATDEDEDQAPNEERDGPVARPEDVADGELYLYGEEDIDAIAAEVFAWLREFEEIDEDLAEEIATFVYELHTGDWQDTLHE